MPRALNSDGESALTLRGKAGLATRLDLAALRKEPAQTGDILVVNLINAVSGEDVHAATATAATTESATTPTKPATAATVTAKSATAATITAEPATTAPTVTTAVIGTGWAVITRRALIRCPLRALLISHRLFLLMCIRY